VSYRDAGQLREERWTEIQAAAEWLCQELGIEGDTYREHAGDLITALLMYHDRNQEVHDAWRIFGYEGSLIVAYGKVIRLMNALWWNRPSNGRSEKPIDNAIDALNYVVFFIRLYRRDDARGAMPSSETD
jgi:hypothetical protein